MPKRWEGKGEREDRGGEGDTLAELIPLASWTLISFSGLKRPTADLTTEMRKGWSGHEIRPSPLGLI